MRRGVLVGLARSISFVIAYVAASPSAFADIAGAEALFREGRELFEAGKVAEACLKFAESQRLDPSPGTLLNLASCHAKQGKAASAWAEFLAAKRAAQTAGRTDLAEEAQRQADGVAGLRSYLTIIVDSPVNGIQVSRGGEALDRGSFGSKLPVDPGRYVVRAVAPGYQEWTTEVAVEGGGEAKEVRVPALVAKPAEPVPEPEPGKPSGPGTTAPPPPKPTPPPERSAPTLAYVIGSAGVVVTGAGLVFGALASSKYGDAEKACPSLKGCSDQAIDDRDSAETFANVANVGVGVGLAAITVGVVLLVTHGPSERREAASAFRVVPTLEPGSAGALFHGAF